MDNWELGMGQTGHGALGMGQTGHGALAKQVMGIE